MKLWHKIHTLEKKNLHCKTCHREFDVDSEGNCIFLKRAPKGQRKIKEKNNKETQKNFRSVSDGVSHFLKWIDFTG